jgi:hypothetical protein
MMRWQFSGGYALRQFLTGENSRQFRVALAR